MKKLLICALVICSLLLTFVGCGKYSEFDDDYTLWEISEDGKTLTDGVTTYTKYGELPLGMRVENEYFAYYNHALYDEYYRVYTSSPASGIRYLHDYTLGVTAYVASEEDAEKLDSFLAGEISGIRVIDYEYYSYFDADASFVAELDGLNTDKINIPVRKLSSADRYDIVYFDSDDLLAYSHGAIYGYEGELYYVNYDKLDNSYFDNLGNFSFGRGTVDMYKLPETLIATVSEKMEYADEYYENVTWENDLIEDEEMSREEAVSAIVFIILVLGVAIPLVPLGIGVILLLKKKDKTDVSTYILVAASLVWIIAGILVLILSL